MEQTDTSTNEPSGERQRSGELVRPVQGRMLGGVARGFADNFGIADWIPRVFFLVTAFIGGFGIALYAACWAFIRGEEEDESPAERFFSGASSSRSWVGIAFMVVAGIIILSNFTFLSGEVIWAVAFLVLGLMLYLGYIPIGRNEESGSSSESKEGVQRMTPTQTTTPEAEESPSGDSPAGGTTPPIPTPTPPAPPPAKPRERSILGSLTIGVMLLGLGVLAILDNVGALALNAQPRHYLALAVTILGLGLLVGSIAGRARWLILVAVFLVPPLLFSPVVTGDWGSANFDRHQTPTQVAQIAPEYHLSVGRLMIDLRQVPWDGEEVYLDASVDAGRLVIALPAGVGIQGSASVDVGSVRDPDRNSSGMGSPRLDWDDTGELGTLLLHAHVNVGSVEIRR